RRSGAGGGRQSSLTGSRHPFLRLGAGACLVGPPGPGGRPLRLAVHAGSDPRHARRAGPRLVFVTGEVSKETSRSLGNSGLALTQFDVVRVDEIDLVLSNASLHSRITNAVERPSSAAGPAGKKSCHEKPFCRPRLLVCSILTLAKGQKPE